MEYHRFAPVIVLLYALCSCASAYYFPNGPPHRPSRQLGENGSFQPEPKENLESEASTSEPSTNDPEIPTLVMDSIPDHHSPQQGEAIIEGNENISPHKPEPRQLSGNVPYRKPEPREFPGLEVVPMRKNPNSFPGRQRQSTSCSQNYAFNQPGQSVVLQSPNYNRQYPNNVQSTTCFSSPSGTTMSVSCDDFNVEYSRSCSYDYLGIALNGNPSSIQKYCGRGAMKSPATSDNSLAIVFRSDYSNPGSTSRNPYRFSCIVTVSGSSGVNPTAGPPGNSSDCTCGRKNDGSRIVGGNNATPNKYPWRCYLKTNQYSFFCGCSIISNQWILTAAHCTKAVMPLQNGDKLYVVVGAHLRNDRDNKQIEVQQVVDDPEYDDRTMDHDVSLLRLTNPVTYSNTISPVCLPFNYVNDEFKGTTVTASGWGATSQGGSTSNILKEVELPVLTTTECGDYYRGQITERMICTYRPGTDTCQLSGDSGGSIDLYRNGRFYHIGVVSWGIGCAQEKNPGVYAKTTKFLTWITKTTGENFCRA